MIPVTPCGGARVPPLRPSRVLQATSLSRENPPPAFRGRPLWYEGPGRCPVPGTILRCAPATVFATPEAGLERRISPLGGCPPAVTENGGKVAPAAGFEPATMRLTAARSTTELRRSGPRPARPPAAG